MNDETNIETNETTILHVFAALVDLIPQDSSSVPRLCRLTDALAKEGTTSVIDRAAPGILSSLMHVLLATPSLTYRPCTEHRAAAARAYSALADRLLGCTTVQENREQLAAQLLSMSEQLMRAVAAGGAVCGALAGRPALRRAVARALVPLAAKVDDNVADSLVEACLAMHPLVTGCPPTSLLRLAAAATPARARPLVHAGALAVDAFTLPALLERWADALTGPDSGLEAVRRAGHELFSGTDTPPALVARLREAAAEAPAPPSLAPECLPKDWVRDTLGVAPVVGFGVLDDSVVADAALRVNRPASSTCTPMIEFPGTSQAAAEQAHAAAAAAAAWRAQAVAAAAVAHDTGVMASRALTASTGRPQLTALVSMLRVGSLDGAELARHRVVLGGVVGLVLGLAGTAAGEVGEKLEELMNSGHPYTVNDLSLQVVAAMAATPGTPLRTLRALEVFRAVLPLATFEISQAMSFISDDDAPALLVAACHLCAGLALGLASLGALAGAEVGEQGEKVRKLFETVRKEFRARTSLFTFTCLTTPAAAAATAALRAGAAAAGISVISYMTECAPTVLASAHLTHQLDVGAAAAAAVAAAGQAVTLSAAGAPALTLTPELPRALSAAAAAVSTALQLPWALCAPRTELLLLTALGAVVGAAHALAEALVTEIGDSRTLVEALAAEQDARALCSRGGLPGARGVDEAGAVDEAALAGAEAVVGGEKGKEMDLEQIGKSFLTYFERRKALLEPSSLTEVLASSAVLSAARDRAAGRTPAINPADSLDDIVDADLARQTPPSPPPAFVAAATAQFRRDLQPHYDLRRVALLAGHAAAGHAAADDPNVRRLSLDVVSGAVTHLLHARAAALLPEDVSELALPPTRAPGLCVPVVEGWTAGESRALTVTQDAWPALAPRFGDAPPVASRALRLLTAVTRAAPRFAAFKVPIALEQLGRVWARGHLLPAALGGASSPATVRALRAPAPAVAAGGLGGVVALGRDNPLWRVSEAARVAGVASHGSATHGVLTLARAQAWEGLVQGGYTTGQQAEEYLTSQPGHLWDDILSLLEAAAEGEICAPRLHPARSDRSPGAELVLSWALLGAAAGQPRVLAERAAAVVKKYTESARGRNLIRAVAGAGYLSGLWEGRRALEAAAGAGHDTALTVNSQRLVGQLMPPAMRAHVDDTDLPPMTALTLPDATGLPRDVAPTAAALALAPPELTKALWEVVDAGVADRDADLDAAPGFGLSRPLPEHPIGAELWSMVAGDMD